MSKMNHGPASMSNTSETASTSIASYYTCVMHPQIHEEKPGKCPICGMTLVKKSAAPEGAKP